MLRTNINTIEGERAGTAAQLYFSDGLFEKGTMGEMSSSEKSMWNSLNAQDQDACRDSVPMLGQPTRIALHF